MGAGLHPKLETSVLLLLLQFATTTENSRLTVHSTASKVQKSIGLKLRLKPALTLSVSHSTVGSDMLTSSIMLESRI